MQIEKKEFLGVTKPSLLACAGMILAGLGAFVWLKHPFGVAIPFIGIVMIGVAIRTNLIMGLDVKYRKLNVIIHTGMLILSMAIITLVGILRYIHTT